MARHICVLYSERFVILTWTYSRMWLYTDTLFHATVQYMYTQSHSKLTLSHPERAPLMSKIIWQV